MSNSFVFFHQCLLTNSDPTRPLVHLQCNKDRNRTLKTICYTISRYTYESVYSTCSLCWNLLAHRRKEMYNCFVILSASKPQKKITLWMSMLKFGVIFLFLLSFILVNTSPSLCFFLESLSTPERSLAASWIGGKWKRLTMKEDTQSRPIQTGWICRKKVSWEGSEVCSTNSSVKKSVFGGWKASSCSCLFFFSFFFKSDSFRCAVKTHPDSN